MKRIKEWFNKYMGQVGKLLEDTILFFVFICILLIFITCMLYWIMGVVGLIVGIVWSWCMIVMIGMLMKNIK